MLRISNACFNASSKILTRMDVMTNIKWGAKWQNNNIAFRPPFSWGVPLLDLLASGVNWV